MIASPKRLIWSKQLARAVLEQDVGVDVVPPRHDRDRAVSALVRQLVEVAAWIAESGFFIGNDSGLGHLASALGVPTPSLFMRRGLALTWRPNWGRGAIVLPHNLFVGGALKERFWKQALRASRVMHSFERLKVELELR
jgi:ADP-heptose:LPS heptosyltransferase